MWSYGLVGDEGGEQEEPAAGPGEGVEEWRSGRRGDGDGRGIVRDREEALLCVEDAAFVVDMVVWEERFLSADHGVDLLLLRIDDLRFPSRTDKSQLQKSCDRKMLFLFIIREEVQAILSPCAGFRSHCQKCTNQTIVLSILVFLYSFKSSQFPLPLDFQ